MACQGGVNTTPVVKKRGLAPFFESSTTAFVIPQIIFKIFIDFKM
jgi:hypothetical protein